MATPEQRRPWVEVGLAGPDARARAWCCRADLSGMDLIDAVRRAPASEYLLVEPTGEVYGVLAAARPGPRLRRRLTRVARRRYA